MFFFLHCREIICDSEVNDRVLIVFGKRDAVKPEGGRHRTIADGKQRGR